MRARGAELGYLRYGGDGRRFDPKARAMVRVIRADITTLAVDAIVNAPSSSLVGGAASTARFTARDEAAKVAVRTLREDLDEHGGIDEVLLVAFDTDSASVLEEALSENDRELRSRQRRR